MAPSDVPDAQIGLPGSDENVELDSGNQAGAVPQPANSPISSSKKRSDAYAPTKMAAPPTLPYLPSIPDHNPARKLQRSDAVPMLINPQDQTARREPRRRWEAIPISWAQPVEDSGQDAMEMDLRRPLVNRPQPPPKVEPDVWDDTGWGPSSRATKRSGR